MTSLAALRFHFWSIRNRQSENGFNKWLFLPIHINSQFLFHFSLTGSLSTPCVASAVAGSPVRAPCCACSVPARPPVEERGTLALELGPHQPPPRTQDPSPPSQPRRASSRQPPSSGIKCKSIPLDLGHFLTKFAASGVRIRGSNMLPKLIDCGTKVYFRNF